MEATGVAATVRAVVLVEGTSDQAAVEALAARRGRDLRAEGVRVVPMGGATNIRSYLERLGPPGSDMRVAALCDVQEARLFRRAFELAGADAAGIFVCDADLEDELIRSLGTDVVEDLIAASGELRSLRTFQRQPAQVGRTPQAQLRRFMGTRSGRKIRYGRLLVETLDLTRVPTPLDGVLSSV